RIEIKNLVVLGVDSPSRTGNRRLEDVFAPLRGPERVLSGISRNLVDRGRVVRAASRGGPAHGFGRPFAKLIGDAPAGQLQQPRLEGAALRIGLELMDGVREAQVRVRLHRTALQ